MSEESLQIPTIDSNDTNTFAITRGMVAKALMDLDAQRRQGFWRFVNSIGRGSKGNRVPKFRKQESVVTKPMAAGQVVQASDRQYVVQADGSWRRRDEATDALPVWHSEIYLPEERKISKYPKTQVPKGEKE